MLQRFIITAIFFRSELLGALIKLRGHPGRLFRRAVERDKDLGKLRNFHANDLIRKGGTQEMENVFLISCVPN
jgi:hypothetical protein